MLRDVARWDDRGDEEEKDQTNEEQQVCGEEGFAQVPVVRDTVCEEAKWRADSSQERCKNISNATLITFFLLCNKMGYDGVGDEEKEGRDDGVELEEGGH